MAARLLVVEDDNDINNLLCEILTRAGYGVTQSYSGTEALLHLEGAGMDLVLLDLMLPGLSGEEVLSRLRAKSRVPVVILSAKDSPQEKARLLRLGADDYMTKPFHEEELLARVEGALRHGTAAAPAQTRLAYKHLELDTAARSLAVHGEQVALTGREFDILALLMQNPAKVFTKANIYQSVWNDEFFGDDNTVNVHISNLRQKLGAPDVIQTVWGIGFKMME